jgi:hypothetical protein
MTGYIRRNILEQSLTEMLQDVPLGVCPVLSLMHDRAPAYCSMDSPLRWIRRSGPLFRHDHSPDLVWRLLICLVYENAVELEDVFLPAQDPVSMCRHTTKAWYFERVGQTDFAPLRFLQ